MSRVDTMNTRKPRCPNCGGDQDTWDMDLRQETIEHWCDYCSELMRIQVITTIRFTTSEAPQ